MSDAISRQAAIRWVKTECNPYGKPTLDYESGKRVMKHLEQMPSAQPEIIRCRECKHYYFADNRIPQEQRYVCDIGGEVWQPDDYCSYAEWREGSK